MSAGPDSNDVSIKEESHESLNRRVEVVTVPVKTIGSLRRVGLRLASWVFGSPLTWAMHWAIRVDETYFELNRPGGVAKPCLRTSTWSKEKQQDIITTVPIGSTSLTDEEIVAASEPYFTDKTRLMWYNIYINNCQLFVQFSLERVCQVTPQSPSPIPPALRLTISLVLSMAIYIISLPPIMLYMQWLRFRGCDPQSLQAYTALYISSIGLSVPMAIIILIQNYNQLKALFETEPALLIAAWASFMTSIMTCSTFLIQPMISFPVAKQRRNGDWEVSTIQNQNNLNQEDIDPEVKIKVSHSWLSAMFGACIGVVLWVVVATPYIVGRSVAFLSGRLVFDNPLAFAVSVWEILSTPVFEHDGRSNAVQADSVTETSGVTALSRQDDDDEDGQKGPHVSNPAI